MTLNSTFKRMYAFQYVLAFLLPLLFFEGAFAQSARVYAEAISSESHTDDSANAVDENLSTRARVRASSGLALGIGAYSGHIELQYENTVPANTTSYIKIQTDDNLLPALLGGSLGNLLSGVLGAVLIGNQEFTVQAKNNGTVLLQGDSQDIGEFATNRLRIVTDKNGDYFIAITPAQDYNRIRLTNRIGSLLGLFNTKNLDVYEAFYVSDPDNCGKPSYTSYSGSGLNLDLINLSGAGVQNPQNAIDDDQANFSKLSLGILAVAASIEQTVYFDGPSNPNDQFDIRLRLAPSLLEVGVANSVQIIAQNGPNTVQTITLGSLLTPELLGLLQSNQAASIPLHPSAPVNRITVRYNSLLNVQLQQSIDLYGITRVPRVPTISDAFTLNPRICAGNTASLVATTAAGYQLNWYSAAQGGSPLATTQSGAAFVTPVLNSDTSYYVAAVKIGCPEESRRVRVNVDVVPVPTAADIHISSPLSACQGNITLTPTADLPNSVIKYYADAAMSQEIVTGFAGHPGVAYTKNETSGALAISGLSASDSPYTYYIALETEGLCTNALGDLAEVVVNYSEKLVVQANPNLSGCGSANLIDAIQNFDPANTYLFFDASNTEMTAEAASNITASGTYYIQAQGQGGTCASDPVAVNVAISAQPTIVAPANALVTNAGNTVTLNATSPNGTISWFDQNGNALASNMAGPFDEVGVYAFTGIVSSGSCTASTTITVTVIDPSQCPPLTQPIYASSQAWSSVITGGVGNPNLAVDSNLQTYSTIVTGVGALGIGTTWQTLQWPETIPAGTPVTLKLGSEYSGLTLLGGVTIVGTKRNAAGTPVQIGTLQGVTGSVLDLLPGQNTFEYTFVPSNISGPQAYDGVRIVIGSLLSVAQNAKVFEAYYTAPATQVACGEDARDVVYGAVDLGIGALTSTVGVDDAFHAIDNSQTSYATLYSGLGVLAAAEMTVVFNTPSIVGDQVRIRISKPGTILSLGLLNGLSIQPMLGNAASGGLVSASLLSLELLNGGEYADVTFTPTASFDRIRIRYGGVAGVLEFLNVYDIERLANTRIAGADLANAVTACQGQSIALEAAPMACTEFIWYDAETGGNVVATGNTFTIPANTPAGMHTYWVQPIRFGCAFLSRGKVTVNVIATAPADAIAEVSINGGSETSICAPDGNVTLSVQLNQSVAITNPVFYWYSSNGTSTTLIDGETSSTLELTGLAPGAYTYYVGLSAAEFCPTATADLTQVSFTILPASAATDISVADAGICLDGIAVLVPTSALPNPEFSWYFTNDTTQPITDGMTVGSVTYQISATGVLTITGLADSGSPYGYFVALSSDSSCINLAGTLAQANVTVGSLPEPTATETTQNFCFSNDPTVADIQVNETGVIFYDAPTGGNVVDASTPLVDGNVYYATLSDGVCESVSRLAIAVTIGNPNAPTTANDTQNFCSIDSPTVANIQVNEPNVVFYDEPIDGTPYAPTDALVAGIYYAATVDGTCQSKTRLAITVAISDPETPTTDSLSQSFCSGSNPTVADLAVDQSNIAVYATENGGTALAPATPLATGTYYVSLVEAGTGCESAVRLEIAVTVNSVGTPTTDSGSQTFCLADAPTVANIQVNETGVIFYDAAVDGNAYDASAPLVSGTYYAALAEGICESDTRLEIAVTVNDPSVPTTSNATQTFCEFDNPTVASLDVNEPNIAVYATIGGSPLDPDTPLAAGTYYVSQLESGCESSNLLQIQVILDNPGIPTTNDAAQDFCASTNPTVANIQVNETGVAFYTEATGGEALDPATPLVTGTYYASFANVSCESGIRLEIAVTVSNPGTPTTNSDSQQFCFADAPTVADIQVNETGVIFYDAAVGGTAFDANAPLATGTYYASISDGICESGTRLEIAVVVENPDTPTTANASQEFCLSDNPTVADIQVNENGAVFYTSANGGTALAADAPLQTGTYFAALSQSGCESAVRLEIAVTVKNPSTPTTLSTTQVFCLSDNPAVADLEVVETDVIFYDAPTGGNPLSATAPLQSGTYYAALVDGDCESAVRLEIAVQLTGTGIASLMGGGFEACISETVTYTTDAGHSNYAWSVTGGQIIAGGNASDNTATVEWLTAGTGTVSVSYTDANCGNTASSSASYTINVCSDLTISKVVDNFTPNIGDEVTFTITVNNVGSSNFESVIINETLPSGYTLVSFHASAGEYVPATGLWTIPLLAGDTSATLEVTVTVNGTGNYVNSVSIDDSVPDDSSVLNNDAEAWVEPLCLIVYNEFTPNGDGNNETFRIDCIENYPNNELEVFNRYGVMVYKTRGYANTWDGIANQNSPVNQDKMLPAGTYFYTLELNDGSGTTKSGWLYIMR